jgi:hypothetical protein
MTLEDLKTHPAFITLGTDQQREWVVAYCTNGADKIKATEAAYACNDTASAVAIANRNLRHPEIKKLVDAYFGRTDEMGSKKEALAKIWRRANAVGVDDVTFLDYMKLYGDWMGFKPSKTEPADSPVDSVDDLVRQLEAQGKV